MTSLIWNKRREKSMPRSRQFSTNGDTKPSPFQAENISNPHFCIPIKMKRDIPGEGLLKRV